MMSNQPLLLDLFCGAGGAGTGYARAGWRVVGVDLDPKPLRHNPHEHYVGDALAVLDALLAGDTWQGYRLGNFAAIHASPVCKGYSATRHQHPQEYPLLIAPTRERLQVIGLPWVLENVVMKGKWRGHMPAAVMLCGTMFGLRVYRHRFFESSHLLLCPAHQQHSASLTDGYVCVYGHTVHGHQVGNKGNKYTTFPVSVGREAMGIDWMPMSALSQAVPPAYTEWLGRQLLAVAKDGAA